ncbi:MAG: antitermination protein NusG, partial [Pirellulaceae bacterium]|nr:antitermination protein NusG [Pirellulaceae bacterium]
MPILNKEPDIFPANLLESSQATDNPWWAMYTLARQEKKLMRSLATIDVAFYAPVIPRRYRSPAGRIRTTYEPLFANYVFVCGDEVARHSAVCTGCISRWMPVGQPLELVEDLRQLHSLIQLDAPLSPERRLEPGTKVRIRSGPFAGYEGVIFRRERETRLQVSVRFMDQVVSVAVE